MSRENLNLGKSGEEAAVKFLKKNGYRIIARNHLTRLGEIDIIARDKDTLCFIEVKTRNSERFGLPEEAVSKAKQKHIAQAALGYLKENNLLDFKARFDVVAVNQTDAFPEIDLIKNAFELDEEFTY